MTTTVIIGAGPGLGSALAHRFGREGHDVIVAARGQERLHALVDNLARESIRAHAVTIDVSDPASIEAAFDRIATLAGTPDNLIFNPRVPYKPPYSAAGIDPAEVEGFFRIATIGAIRCTNRVLDGMVARGSGTLLYTMGGSVSFPFPMMAPVGVATAGLLNYARVLGAELQPQGIWVGSMIVAARIEAGTDASPEKVADAYWRLYSERAASEHLFSVAA